MRLKGIGEKTISTLFWVIFALGAIAVLFLIAVFIFVRFVGVKVV